MYFGIHIKSIHKENYSYHYNPAIQERIPPVWQGVVHQPWHSDEKHRENTDPQQTENSNNKYFIIQNKFLHSARGQCAQTLSG